MIRTTREQRDTLKRKWIQQNRTLEQRELPSMTYREFRSKIQSLICGNGCIMVPWNGMWLGIETDGVSGS